MDFFPDWVMMGKYRILVWLSALKVIVTCSKINKIYVYVFFIIFDKIFYSFRYRYTAQMPNFHLQ